MADFESSFHAEKCHYGDISTTLGIFVAQWNHNVHQKYLLKNLQVFKSLVSSSFSYITFPWIVMYFLCHSLAPPFKFIQSPIFQEISFSFLTKKFYILLRDLLYLAWEDNGKSHYCILFKNSRDGMYIQNFLLQSFLNEHFNDINCNDSIMQHCHHLFSKILIAPNRNSVTINW